MKKTTILFSAALMFFGLTAKAQTTITFDTEDYKAIGVYDMWEESPFRTGKLEGNAGVATNPSTTPDEVLGVAPNTTGKVVAFQRSRYASNAYGVRIDLKEPIRVTKELQYIHVMTYLKDKPADSRMMVIGLGKRLEESWSWQTGEEEQFWSTTTANVKPKDGWQDIVVSFKGFSYSKAENANSGIDIYSLVIVPDVRTPQADATDWVAYFDEIVVDNNPDKRFSTEMYALTYDEETNASRNDRVLNKVGLTVGDKTYESAARSGKFYSNNTTTSVFSAKAGAEVQPTFNYTGGWMSGYVYVDWGCDALFKDVLNDNGTSAEGSDVVSHSAVELNGTWYKSDGSTTGNGNTIGAGVPKFTVPVGTSPGFYRMRYKVDWNSINPAGGNTIISDGGGIVDVMLDVHGDEVTVNASQLNGDILLASDNRALQNYKTGYEQPLTVKIVPENGFVQYGFTLKYGYNVNASEQLDEKGNPNWIEVLVPYTAIAGDGTYTIPAEYMRGSHVSIKGDMQQVQQYTVKVVGLEGQGGAVYANIETPDGGTINATQFFTVEQVAPIAVEGYDGAVTLEGRIVTVTYTLGAEPCREITSLTELKNYKLYQIKSNNNEGYLAWNTNITDTYLSLRGVTNFQSGEPNADIRVQYAEEVNPFDETVVWQIIQEDDKYYLYHPARNGYVTRDGRDYKFTETKTALDAIRDNGDGTFSFHAGGGYSDGSTNFACIVTNENSIAVRNWTWDDHGSVMQIIENPNVYTLEYIVEVTGSTEGGITFEGKEYAHDSTLKATRFLTAKDIAAKEIVFSAAEVTVDQENAKISVAYGEKAPKFDKYYTFSCFSSVAHNTTKFICDNGSVIDGQSETASYFLFEAGEETGTYYIKSAVSGKYINSDGNTVTASKTKSTAWKLGFPSHTPNAVTFGLSGDKYLNNNGTKSDGTCNHLQPNTHSGGPGAVNACSLWELHEYELAYTVTYSFKYDGVERFSQTAQVGKDETYPDYNVQLPYGVVAAAKPTGIVDRDTLHDVVLTIGQELPLTAAASVESITTWYYTKMHTTPGYTKYLQSLEDNRIEWADAEVPAGEEESHLWAFVGNLWDGLKVISKTGKAIVSTSGDAKLGDAANATSFIPMSSSTGVENGFCLKYPGSNYLNAQDGYIKTWDYNDPGSTILLEEYIPTTGIQQLKNDEAVVIYDLMGRRVTQPAKGVYIINGKKKWIK